jgi:hypothetical protein
LTVTDVANGAIVPAGTGGEITAFASKDTDLLIDIDGYFAQPTQGKPWSVALSGVAVPGNRHASCG